MDVLSEVLRAVRLTGAVYFDVPARAPWVADTPPLADFSDRVMPGFEFVIPFHILLAGRCWAELREGAEPPVPMEVGDAVLIPQGEAHALASEPGLHSEPDYELYRRRVDRPLPFALEELGGEGEPARFVCGYLGCDARPFNPLLNALPRVVRAKSSGEGDPTLQLIRLALDESKSGRAGGETVLARLSELMFVQALRRYIDEQPPGAAGWLSGLRDPHVGAALSLIHGRPGEDWTLEGLAREVGLSRSALAERFSHYVHEPPMRYLARWRMQLALRALESPRTSIAEAAARVGYQSEAAFNRAFKKYLGLPPGEWRRAHTAATDAEPH